MKNILEVIKAEMKSKSASVTTILMIPTVLFAGWIYYLLSSAYFESREGHNAAGIIAFISITILILGIYTDLASHITCRFNGNKIGLIMGICANVLEALGTAGVAVCLCAAMIPSVRWGNLIDVPWLLVVILLTVLFPLAVILWKVLEAASLIEYLKLMMGRVCKGKMIAFEGISIFAGVVLAIIYLVCSWSFNEMIYSKSQHLWSGAEFLMSLGFAFVPAYVISQSVHSLKMRRKINRYID